MRNSLLTALLVLFVAGCDQETAAPGVAVQRIGTSPGIPHSSFPAVSLVGQFACVTNDFEFRIECGTMSWDAPRMFGQEGQGPGEFAVIGRMVSIGDTMVAVVDWKASRLSLFSLRDGFVRSVPIPGLFTPIGEATDGPLVGTFQTFDPNEEKKVRLVWLDIGSGETVKTVALVDPLAGEKVIYISGRLLPERREVIVRGEGYSFLRFDIDGPLLARFGPTDLVDNPRTDRDVEEYQSDMRRGFGFDPSEADLEDWRSQPRTPIVPESNLVTDGSGRLWVATTRDWVRWSYFDVFENDEQIGSVSIEGRVRGFDISGDTLVALVELEEPDGPPLVQLHWYLITD